MNDVQIMPRVSFVESSAQSRDPSGLGARARVGDPVADVAVGGICRRVDGQDSLCAPEGLLKRPDANLVIQVDVVVVLLAAQDKMDAHVDRCLRIDNADVSRLAAHDVEDDEPAEYRSSSGDELLDKERWRRIREGGAQELD